MDIVHAEIVKQNTYYFFKDLAVINDFIKAEFMLGKDPKLEHNDFEVQFYLGTWLKSNIKIGDWLYIPQSEWGGRIEKIEHNENTIKVSGPNFRYFIGQDIIYPYYNYSSQKLNAYLQVEGEANKVLDDIKKSVRYRTTARMYEISNENTNVQIKDQFRFTYFLEGVTQMLDRYQMRLVVKHKNNGLPLLVCAEKVQDFSENFNNDYNVNINSTISVLNDITFMTGLGKGELENRQVLLMIRDESGKITEFAPYVSAMELDTGISKQYIYNQPNAESIDELRKGMHDKFNELRKNESISIDIKSDNDDFNLGDLVGGTDEVTGLSIKQQITQKILTITSKGAQISYKVGG